MAKKNSKVEATIPKVENVQAVTAEPIPIQVPNKWKAFGNITWLQISLAIITVSMLAMSFYHGITGDDIVVNEYGKEILKFITGLGSYEYNYEHPLPKQFDRDLVIQYYGGLFSVICVLINKISPFSEYTTIHLLNALTGVLATWFAAKICRRFISEGAAILVVWLMFLSPFWLGNAMNNPKDTPFAATYIIAIYLIFRHIENINKATYKQYILLAIAIACSINVRVGGILLIPYLFAFVIGANIWERFIMKLNTSLFRGIGPVIVISIGAYLGCSLLWPNALHDPINHPLNSLSALTHIPVALNQLWEGTKIMSAISDPESDGMFVSNMGASYLPKAMAITTPLIIVAGFILSFIMLALHKNKKNLQYAFLLMILFSALFPVIYIIYKKSNLYHLWRHTLFVFPSICILAAYAFSSIITTFNKPIVKYAVIALIVLGLAEPLYFIIRTHPNTMSYFNSLVGGTKKAYGNYEVDFYYNSVKESSDWFEKQVVSKLGKADSVIVATNAPHILSEYYKNDPRVKVQYVRFYQRHEAKYDYSLFHIAMIPEDVIRSGTWAKGNVIYSAKVDGKIMNCIFKKVNNDDAEGMAMLKANNPMGISKLISSYKADPSNELVANTLINVYMQNNQIDSAYFYINDLYNKDSSSLDNMTQMGNYYNAKQNPEAAKHIFNKEIKICNDILEKQPQNHKAMYDLAIAQLSIGDAQNALQNFNASAQNMQIAPMAYQYMSRVYSQAGDNAKAQQYMTMAQQAASGGR
jgi:tetratricopeptide (TPR) repeat protein